MAPASDAVIEMLFKAHPDAVKEKEDECGWLPLVIEMLFKAHPDAVKEKSAAGRLPLHLALMAPASDAVIEMLFKAHPDAVKEKDEDGWLPLHRALAAAASDAVIELLFKAHPDAVQEKSSWAFFFRLPLHTALVAGRKMSIERTVGQVLPQLAARVISKFVCG
eukprot:NODE_24279_length_631_cov_3.416667.p3 GENE.NODE_24279_length_631_cov_3.416667~~NODE_24279_length_631_cov_3.416667.p3  ORF type:complete len:176 (-),score=45.05 NODE_24279_length_631_cov_3.416667:102-593(-)